MKKLSTLTLLILSTVLFTGCPFTDESTIEPVPETLLDNVVQVAAGHHFTCARTSLESGGNVYCWGSNHLGQIGNPTALDGEIYTSRAEKVRNDETGGYLSGAIELSAGQFHACAVLETSQIKCWGFNSSGQLGDYSNVTTGYPDFVKSSPSTPMSNLVSVSTGTDHSCVLFDTNRVGCMGSNDKKQLGNINLGSIAYLTSPNVVRTGPDSFLENIIAISSGTKHSCAIQLVNSSTPSLLTTKVYCWGHGGAGQLGRFGETPDSQVIPKQIWTDAQDTLLSAIQIDAGYHHTCVRLMNGEARCWGNPYDLRLGSRTDPSPGKEGKLYPVKTIGNDSIPLTDIAQITAGDRHGCARLTDGKVVCFGANTKAQVGRGFYDDTGDQPQATNYVLTNGPDSDPIDSIIDVSAGKDHTCAVNGDGNVLCWGDNQHAQVHGDRREGKRIRTQPVLVLKAEE